jgi:hypothetical protein
MNKYEYEYEALCQEFKLENGDITSPFLISALGGGKWSASHLGE